MQLQFLGATDTVTGSKYLVTHRDARMLVDCGLFQGYKQLRLRNWAPLPVKPTQVEAVVLTHAHIDHSGWLPLLVREGFAGRIFCTRPTADLCRILLPDAGGLQEEEAQFLNRHHLSKHSPALPLYTREDAVRCLRQLEPVDFGAAFEPLAGLKTTLRRAGHMPGAASALLDNGTSSLMFSGDLGRPQDLLMRAPDPAAPADRVIVESTYGDRLHRPADLFGQLAHVIGSTAARGGAVVIPAFAVGRAQLMMHLIATLKRRGAIPAVPVYLNSPMASDATSVFLRHRGELRLDDQQCEAMVHGVNIVRTTDESRELCARRGPMVIIAGSGMATGGRVLHHLRALAPDRRNTVLLCGYQAGGTRGASLAAGASTLRIHGEDVPVRCHVEQIEGASAHADAAEIEAWLRGIHPAPRATFITHGEPAAADAMRQRIERGLGWAVCMPEYLQSYAA
jgi:metallo-beta-lactamase family protein